MDAFWLILAMLGLGLGFQHLRTFPDNAAEVLNKVVLYVCLPAAVLLYAPRLQLGAGVLAVAAVPWALVGVTVLAVAGLTRLLGLRRDEKAVLLLCVALGNTSFLGYPLVRALLGEDALPYAVVYDQFGAFLILSTFGLYVLARYGGDADPTAREIGRRIVTFPPFLAMVFGLTLMPAEPPAWIAGGLQRLSDALLPLVVLAIGLGLKLKLPRDELRPLAAGLTLKLGVMPAVALALVWLLPLGLEPVARDTVVLESAMPPMVTAAALAISHRLAPGLASAMVGYGILLSLATLPAWTWLLKAMPL
ncbi:MAG: malate permease [Arenimonas sp. SCN 70-307]|uniref:AEC family transporter n=1 Tax=Arenimonas sp. SCN 70-307 TaxID=1660089 RepID=UPI00086CA540|nr:AEC family transporter [Arenimonas sp. SCN 70-307]ODS64349.1 MAG: malate permease [Arenimonas sp. SCN 70-307]